MCCSSLRSQPTVLSKLLPALLENRCHSLYRHMFTRFCTFPYIWTVANLVSTFLLNPLFPENRSFNFVSISGADDPSKIKHRQVTDLDVTDLGFSGLRIPFCATRALWGRATPFLDHLT